MWHLGGVIHKSRGSFMGKAAVAPPPLNAKKVVRDVHRLPRRQSYRYAQGNQGTILDERRHSAY